jgi:hypothetical protein
MKGSKSHRIQRRDNVAVDWLKAVEPQWMQQAASLGDKCSSGQSRPLSVLRQWPQ